MLHAAHEEAEKKGFHLIINSLSQDDIDRCAEPHFFKKTIRGILIAGYVEKPFILRLLKKNVPVVLLGYDIVDPPLDCVKADNLFGAYLAVKHLISKGHRRIGLIGGIPTHHSPLARMQGYKMALEQAGLPLIPEIMTQDLPISCDRMGYQATQNILESYGTEVDAFFCVTDNFATGCMKAIRDFGLEVPRDISVMGFDDMPWVEHLSPALSTMRIPTHEMGSVGTRRLIHLIEAKQQGEEKESPQKIELPVQLVARESVAEAKAVSAVSMGA
jgi:LacI family transcriptional regulator